MANLMEEAFKKLKQIKKAPKIDVQIPKENAYFNQNYVNLSTFINERLKSLEKDFKFLLKIEKFQTINFKSDKPFFSYGMIMSPTGNKVAKDEIYMANFIDGNLKLVKMSFPETLSYFIYSGLVVAVEAENNDDGLVIKHLYSIPTVKVFKNEPSNLNLILHKGILDKKDIQKIGSLNAEVVILLGPFCSKEFTFEKFISEIENEVLNINSHTNIVLVPSLEDINFINIIPQPSISLHSEELGINVSDKVSNLVAKPKSRIYCITNPGYLKINGHDIYIANYDIINEIKDSTILSKEFNPINEVQDICYPLIYQKTFLPVFPSDRKINFSNSLIYSAIPNIYITYSSFEFVCNKDGISNVINLSIDNSKYILVEYDSKNPYNYIVERKSL